MPRHALQGRVVGAVALAMLALTMTSLTAGAVQTVAVDKACAGTASWSFSTLLDEGFRTGTIATSFTATCDVVAVGGAVTPPPTVEPVTTTENDPFQGSCVVATFSWDYNSSLGTYLGSGLLVGGSVAVAGDTGGDADALVELAPQAPCQESSAMGTEQEVVRYRLPPR